MGESKNGSQNGKYQALLSSSDPRIMVFDEGQFIFKAGEPTCNGCWFLVQGRIAMLNAQGKKISELSGLNLFGERAFILEKPHSCSAQALEPSKIVFIDRQDFFEMITKQPEILDKLLKKWFGRLQQTLDAIANLSAKIDRLIEENKKLNEKNQKLLEALRTLQSDLDQKDEKSKTFLEELSTIVQYVDFVLAGISTSPSKKVLKEEISRLISLIDSQKS